MKPISVRFQCFGPYKKEVFVSFEELERNGLFLICGETGAGKTTILDAICYALYGKSSGGNRGDLSVMRCKLAAPTDETVVEFTFETNGKCYRFLRSLRYGRKNLIDSHNCMVLQDGNYVPLFENPKLKNVNQKAEELVGLTHEQFRQVIILPQGQFEKLLTSDSVEKEKILVSLFRAEKWQNIAEEMYRRVAEEDKKLREEMADVRSRLADYKCEKIEELELLATEEETKILELGDSVKKAEEKESEQKKIYEKALRMEEQWLELNKRENQLNQLEEQRENMQSLWEALKRADLAEEIEKDQEAFANAQKECEQSKRKTLQGEVQVQGAKETLAKVEERKKAHEAGKTAYENGVHRLALLENAKGLYISLAERKKEAEQAGRIYQNSRKNVELKKTVYDKKHQTWLQLMELQREKLEQYTSAQQLYLEGISGTLAERLVSGKPCPVCGSVVHPAPAVQQGNKVTETDLDRYNQEMQCANKEVEKAAATRTEAESVYQGALTEMNEAGQKAAILETAYKEILRQKIDGIETMEALEGAILDLKQRIDKYNELTVRFQNMLLEAQTNLNVSEDAYKKAKETEEEAEKILAEKAMTWNILLKQKGFSSDEEYRRCWMQSEEKNREKEKVLRYQAELSAAKKALDEQKIMVQDSEKPEVLTEKQKLNELAEECKQISKNYILRMQTFEKMQKDLKSFSKRKEVYDMKRMKVDADLDFVNRLRGRTGISLQRYVLGVMLSSITAEANRLLKNVHGGRYQLYRTDAIAGSGHKGGLELEVLDAQSNERRSVTTLSGGEKFLVALSLAIGLSTVVQAQGNGIRLGAMFIDEGFGSLDQNSIYDALEILQGIQKANGLVGIISHVELLKDVIPTKIEVHKKKSGSELIIH